MSSRLTLVSRARFLPFFRSDGGEGVWSMELTFLSQLRNLAAGVGMKIRPHVKSEYRYYSLESALFFKPLFSLFCLFKLHTTFLEDFKNDHKLWEMERLPKSGL